MKHRTTAAIAVLLVLLSAPAVADPTAYLNQNPVPAYSPRAETFSERTKFLSKWMKSAMPDSESRRAWPMIRTVIALESRSGAPSWVSSSRTWQDDWVLFSVSEIENFQVALKALNAAERAAKGALAGRASSVQILDWYMTSSGTTYALAGGQDKSLPKQ